MMVSHEIIVPFTGSPLAAKPEGLLITEALDSDPGDSMPQGIISSYTTDMGVGIIGTPTHERFIFTRVDWVSSGIAPEAGMDVTFDIAGTMALRVSIGASETV